MKRPRLAAGLLSVLCLLLALPASLPAQTFRVTLLGTGSPPPALDRFGPSILVEAGSEKLLFDVGRGASQRLSQLGVSYSELSGVFFTHLHSDHVVGLPDLWLTGWLQSRRESPLSVYGPTGTAAMARHLEEAFSADIEVRIREGKMPVNGSHLAAHEIAAGVVLERGGVRVTAFEVDHGPTKPAFGYRVDYAGRAVVLSGDTRYSPNLIAHAQGAALLIHEVAAATGEDLQAHERTRIIVGHHTTPARAGEVFDLVRPMLAVYSHIVLFPGVTEADLIALTRTHYAGPLVVGHDLMRFEIGDSITVLESGKPASAPATTFGRPSVMGRNDGEARTFQGRRPIWIKVDPETLGSRSFTVGMEDLPPGDSIGVHKHMQEDEVVFVHRGHVQVTLGDSSRSAEAGGLVFIPRGTWIGFHVLGADTATIVFLFNTPGFEKCLRFLSAPVGTTFVPRTASEVAAARKDCHQVRRVDEVH